MNNRIRLLITSDIHGAYFPYKDADNSPSNSGIARLKTLIDLMRNESTLLLDNGDFLSGSLFSRFHSLHHPDEVFPITRAMKELHYDYVNIGNHDLDYGTETVFRNLDALGCPYMTANVLYHSKPIGANYAVREIAGKKLVLFAVTNSISLKEQQPAKIRHLTIRDEFETVSRTVELVRRLEKPDIVIVMYHGGFERDPETGMIHEGYENNSGYRILRDIPGIDILIVGHTHIPLCGTAFSTAYLSVRKSGRQLGCIDIYTDTGVIEPRLITSDAPADESLLALADEEEKEFQTWMNTPVAHTSMDLAISDPFAARFHKSQAVTLVNHVLQEASGADLSAYSLYTSFTGFHPEITYRDVMSCCRHIDHPVVKEITGSVLKQYLEKTAEYWAIDGNSIIVNPRFLNPTDRSFLYDMVDGIEYTIRVSNDPGSRIEQLTRNGVPIADDDVFTICLPRFRASGQLGYSCLQNLKTVRSLEKTEAEYLLAWLEEHQNVSFEPSDNITVIR
ncbi:MAG: bifunctional metallophosphatase/5'-nucleotidase [Solobacterium sp.]|nr:bifunctional metallophosphatase/5'-nucleotidase [Solobacterium sp.]